MQTNEPEEDTQIADGTSNRAFTSFYIHIHAALSAQHYNLRAILTTREHRKPPTTPLIPLIYSQILLTIFPPIAKLLHTPIKTYNTPQFLNTLSGRSENFFSFPKPGGTCNLFSEFVNAET